MGTIGASRPGPQGDALTIASATAIAAAWADGRRACPITLEPCVGGTSANVLLIRDATGTACGVLKQPHTPGGFTAEVDALTAIAALGAGDAHGAGPSLCGRVPRLLAIDAPRRAFVLELLPGASVVSPSVDIVREVGRIRRALDAVACTPDPLPLDEAWLRRCEGWLARARALLGDVVVEHAAEVLRGPWPHRERRLCHRDLGPHNWLVDDAGHVGVIDFGHARADDPLVDLVHATAPPWDDDARVDAFIDGWCGTLDTATWALATRIAVALGLGAAVWGRRHGASRFIALGDAMLARARDPRSRWHVGP